MRAASSRPSSAIVAVPSVATLRHLRRARTRVDSIQELTGADGGEVSLLSESDDGIDSVDEDDEYEHYEKLVTTRILVGLDLETLNHCLTFYGCNPERRRRVAAKELARQFLQESDSDESEDSHPTH